MPGLAPLLVACFACGILAIDFWHAGQPPGSLPSTSPRLAVLATIVLGAPLVVRAVRRRRGRARGQGAARSVWGLAAVAFLLGCQLHGDALLRAERAAARLPAEAVVEGRLAGLPLRSRGGGTLFVLRDAVAIGADASPAPSRIQIAVDGAPELSRWLAERVPGEVLRLRVRWRALRGAANPGGRDRARRAARRGLGAVGQIVDPALIVGVASTSLATRGLRRVIALRSAAIRVLEARGQGGALLAALAFGERAALSDATRASFSVLGLSHLLAVSGLHLGLVAALAYGAIRRGLLSTPFVAAGWAAGTDVRRFALAGGVAAAIVYGLVAGGAPPVQRASVFVACVGIAWTLRRRISRVQILALAAGTVLLLEPAALFEAGAQLSFAASAALLWASPLRPCERLGRGFEGARQLAAASSAAVVATAPVLVAHGATPSSAGLLFNLIAVPFTAFVLLPGALLAAVLAAAEPFAPSGIVGAGVDLAAWIGERSIAALQLVSERLEGDGGVASGLAASGAAWGAAPLPRPWQWGLALGAAVLALRLSRLSARILAVGLAIAALRILPPPVSEAPVAWLLDMGQSDALVFQQGDRALLIDGGRALPGRFDLGRSRVVPALRSLGVSSLWLIAATHADLDHRGGLVAVIDSLPVEQLWLPRGGLRDPAFRDLLRAATRQRARVTERGWGDRSERFGSFDVTPLWPPEAVTGSRNDGSLVLRVGTPGGRVLVPGDLEATGERALLATGADLRAAVLLLPHHGSGGSSGEAFLAAVDPEVALVSAACRGRSGLPAEAALARARERGAALWWSGRDGAIRVDLSVAGPRVWGWRPWPGCPPAPD